MFMATACNVVYRIAEMVQRASGAGDLAAG